MLQLEKKHQLFMIAQQFLFDIFSCKNPWLNSHSIYNCNIGLLSLQQFNRIKLKQRTCLKTFGNITFLLHHTRGSRSNAIDVRLAAELIKFNHSIGFQLIESIEFSKVFYDWFDECLIAFRLHSTAIRLHSIY